MDVLGVDDLSPYADIQKAHVRRKVTYHEACHLARELGVNSQPRLLIGSLPHVEMVETEQVEVCCGFGGTFAVKHPNISVAILDRKLEALEELGVEALVSGDAGCLMQMEGRLSRNHSKIRGLHLAEILASR